MDDHSSSWVVVWEISSVVVGVALVDVDISFVVVGINLFLLNIIDALIDAHPEAGP